MNMTQMIKASRNLVKYSALGLAAAAMLGVGTRANAAPPVMDGLIVSLAADGVNTGDGNQVRTSGSDIFVKQWNDQSGNDHNATQTTDGDQPKYIASGVGGMPVLQFTQVNDGAGSKMILGDLSTHFPTAGSMFAVATINSDGRYNLFDNRGNDSRWVADTWAESQPGVFRGARTGFDSNKYGLWPQTGSHVFAMESSSSLYRFVIDGTQIGSTGGDYNSGSGQNWVIGDRPGNGQQLNGDIAELLIYDHVLTPDDANAVGRYLADKYGVTTTYVETTPQAKITAFGPGAAIGAVVSRAAAIAWTVPYGTAVTNLAPTFTLSANAKCYSNSTCTAEISSGAHFNFTSPVHYFVVSSDSLITNNYTVTVSVTPVSTAKEITSFSILGINGTIDGFTIAQNVPFGTDVSKLVPAYTVSQFATGSPTNGATVNFTGAVTYTVTAQDSSTQDYVVTVNELPDNPVTINLAYNNSMDGVATWQQTGSASRAAPLAYRGTTWNNGGNGGSAVSDLKDSENASTGISVSQVLRNHGNHGFGGMGGNKLVSAGLGFGAWSAGDNAIMGQFQDILTFSGMDMSHSYDIAFALPQNDGRTAIYKYGALEASGPCATLSDWTVAQNYALLTGCIPRTDGKVTLKMNCNGIDWSAFCGIQLLDNGVRTTPNSEALIYSFNSFAGAGPVTMSGTDISMPMEVGSSVSALIPTFTMSGSATCTLATVDGTPIVSGTTPVDFTSPVHFIVKSEDGVTTTDYTVTVNLVVQSGKVYVNFDSSSRTGLVGPAGGLGETWNQLAATSTSGLLDSVGLPISVGYTSSNLGGPDQWGGPSLVLLQQGLRNFDTGAGNSQQFVITGLKVGKKYDLWIASANLDNGQRHNGVWSTSNGTSTPGNHACGNTGGLNGDTWVEGNNYVLFKDVAPDESGRITVDGRSIFVAGFDCRLPLSGFQLEELPPKGTVLIIW